MPPLQDFADFCVALWHAGYQEPRCSLCRQIWSPNSRVTSPVRFALLSTARHTARRPARARRPWVDSRETSVLEWIAARVVHVLAVVMGWVLALRQRSQRSCGRAHGLRRCWCSVISFLSLSPRIPEASCRCSSCGRRCALDITCCAQPGLPSTRARVRTGQ
jgi:hypothetical protein